MLHRVVLTFESVDEILNGPFIKKALEHYFFLVSTVLYFKSTDKALLCDHLNDCH